MSPDPTIDSSATELGTFAHQGVLAAGSSYTDTETVDLPVGVSGSFYFIVQTDVNGQVFQDGATADNVGATSRGRDDQLDAASRPGGGRDHGPGNGPGEP